jgi:hypothetical protein
LFRVPAAAAIGLVVAAVGGAPCAAQSFQATLSRDTVPMGEVLELLVRVPVPPASVVYFPDTVASTDVLESHGVVRWEAEPAEGGGATLTLAYPVIAYGAGLVPVPGFDIFVSPAGAAPTRTSDASLPGGSSVGAWADAPTRGASYVRPLRVPRRGVWVPPVFSEEQSEAGVEPQPPADVIGSSWHWPSVALGLLFGAGFVALGVREWRRSSGSGGRSRGGVRAWTPGESRRDALEQLDLLLAERLPAAGRMHELYTRSSAILRRFVGRLDPRLGADLTSSELMGRLEGRTNGREGTALFREMASAEVVKFGRLLPDEGEAEAHVRALREWVERSGDSL